MNKAIMPPSPEQDIFGWYGKIPAAGDFVHRRVPRSLVDWWDRWIQTGMTALAKTDTPPRTNTVMPIWNFAIPGTLGLDCIQMGCLAPSRDKVGRCFPVCAVLYLPLQKYHPYALDTSGDYYGQLGHSLLSTINNRFHVDDFDRELLAAFSHISLSPPEFNTAADDILSILGGQSTPARRYTRPTWPDLSVYFNPSGHTSYWWTNQADGFSLCTHLHEGRLDTHLFSNLFTPLQKGRASRPAS